MKTFEIVSQGNIKGGTCSYDYDGKGTITYNVTVTVKIGWIFSKTFTESGKYTVVLADMIGSTWTVGTKKTFGPVTMLVTSIANNVAMVSLSLSGYNFTGTALVEMTNPIELDQLDANGSFAGISLPISLRPVSMTKFGAFVKRSSW